MRKVLCRFVLGGTTLLGAAGVCAEDGQAPLLAGHAAIGDWHDDAPGIRRRIAPADLPKPFVTPSADNIVEEADPPEGATPKVPLGFSVEPFATGLQHPRLVRVAPNGDIFVVEMAAGRIRVLRAADGAARAGRAEVYAEGLDIPFGVAFYPPGPDPKWLYVANTNSVVRFAYTAGDLEAQGLPETIVPQIAGKRGGHITRDIQFSADGKRMFVSIGSDTNVGESLPAKTPEQLRQWQDHHALGAAWGDETDRANVLAFDPDGGHRRVFAAGIRNCVGLAVQPRSDTLWCSTNERDRLGDDLVPDYVTRVRDGAFYGWPWFYIGANEDPRRRGERPDLARKITVPDVLLQSHSAPLQMAFYETPSPKPPAFPAEYQGDAFVALHGSWNRAKRTGYKVIRVRLQDGVPTGEYDDFMTGFVIDDASVWGRPVGVAVAHDGALLVTQDDNGIVWRIAFSGLGKSGLARPAEAPAGPDSEAPQAR